MRLEIAQNCARIIIMSVTQSVYIVELSIGFKVEINICNSD